MTVGLLYTRLGALGDRKGFSQIHPANKSLAISGTLASNR